MLKDLLIKLAEAKSKEEKEEAYKLLEKVGVDRITADFWVANMK